jgi:hypothetical protein
MALFPPGDNYPIDIYPVKNPLDGTEMLEIHNQGTKKLYARMPDIAAYIVGVQSVISNLVSTPPVSPADQDAYIVATGGTGAWLGKDNQIAVYNLYYRTWVFITPKTGWVALVTVSGIQYLWNGTSWSTPYARGQFTLTANATSTVVTNTLCQATSVILVMPVTADAANDLAIMWFAPTAGSFTVNHANNARVDRTFNYVIH